MTTRREGGGRTAASLLGMAAVLFAPLESSWSNYRELPFLFFQWWFHPVPTETQNYTSWFCFWERQTLLQIREFCIPLRACEIWNVCRVLIINTAASGGRHAPFFAAYPISFYLILPCPGLLSVSPTHFHAFFHNTCEVQNGLSLSAGQVSISLTNPPF